MADLSFNTTDTAKSELQRITTSRKARGDDRKADSQSYLAGLALSSGGFRSATFCFGVLQGLARSDLLRGIDYLSCVGGGGYAGGWLAINIAGEGFEKTHRMLRETQSRMPGPKFNQFRLNKVLLIYLPSAIVFLMGLWAAKKGFSVSPVSWTWLAMGIFGVAAGIAQLFDPLDAAQAFTRNYARRHLDADINITELGKIGPYPLFVAATDEQTPLLFSPLFTGRGNSYEKAYFLRTAQAIAASGPFPDYGKIHGLIWRRLLFRTRPLPGRLFDSLGVYELIRRQCRFIIACDATSDPGATFEGLGNVIRRCRRDFGVEVEFSVDPLRPALDGERARKHYQMGSIRYPDGKTGVLLCLKPALTGDEPVDLIQYSSANPVFPLSEARGGAFDEDEAESYRRLGQHTIETLSQEIKSSAGWAKMPVEEVFGDIRRQLRPELEKPAGSTDMASDAPAAPLKITIPPELIDAITSGECVLCAGAGLAAQSGLPTWPALLEQVLSLAESQAHLNTEVAAEISAAIAAGDLEEAGDELAHRLPASLVADYLKTMLPETAKPSRAHQLLASMPFLGALNTSLDPLLARAFDLKPLLPSDAGLLVAALSSNSRFVVNLSGLLARPSSVVLNARQFRTELSTDPERKQFLTTLFLQFHTVFVGSNIDGISSFLDALGLSKPPARRQYALIAREGQMDPVKARYLDRTFNVQVIEYDPGFNFAGFAEYLEELHRKTKDKAVPVRAAKGNLTLSSVKLENIGPFESISLDFTSGWNLLLGDNGKGKTVILRAIAAGLCGEYTDETVLARLLRSGCKRGTISLMVNNREYVTVLTRDDEDSRKVQIKPSGLSPIRTDRWLVIGFPALRSIPWENPAAPDNTLLKAPSAEDLLPLLRGAPDSRVSNLKQWLINLDYLGRSTTISDFFDALRNMTPGVRIGGYEIDKETKEIRIDTDGGSVPISAVSQGTGSVMCWIGTLVQRMGEAEVSSEGRPLVLIDEIDAHMHPRWQQLFVAAFRKQFPSVQVIATTHSPLMVGSLSKEEIWLIRRGPLTTEIAGIAHIRKGEDGKTEVVVTGTEPDQEESGTQTREERRYLVPATVSLRIRDGENVEANEALTSEDVRAEAGRLDIPPEGWRVDQILTLPFFGLETTRDPKTTKLLEEYTQLVAMPEPDRDRLDTLAAQLQMRAPLPHETKAARDAFEIIREVAREKIEKLPAGEKEKVLAEVKAQFTESITGSGRPL